MRNRISVRNVINKFWTVIFWRHWICFGTKIAWNAAAATVDSATSAPHCSRVKIFFCAKVITWGEKCDCEEKLGTSKSNNNPFSDWRRLYGNTGLCSACNKLIPAFEMVMRAKRNVYHLECFACQQCNHRSVAVANTIIFKYSFGFPSDFALAIDSICVITKFCAKVTMRSVRCALKTTHKHRMPCRAAITTTTTVLIKISSVRATIRNRHRHSNNGMATTPTPSTQVPTFQPPIRCRHFTQTISWTTVMYVVLPKCQ